MNRLFLLLSGNLLSLLCFAQTDMIIYQNYGPMIIHSLAAVDSITYTDGTLGNAPIIETLPPLTGFGNSAISGGIISHPGGSEILSRGICWSSEMNPTIDDQVNFSEGGDYFITSLSNLIFSGDNNYYVRAFA